MKNGIGNVANDKSVTVDTKGLKDVLAVELIDGNGNQITSLSTAGFNIGTYDDIVLTYSGTNISTVTYKLSSVIVGVLTLTYDSSSNLLEVKRTI